MTLREPKRIAPPKRKRKSSLVDEQHSPEPTTDLQRTLGNTATHHLLHSEAANPADLQSRITTLQPMIGNSGVQRMLKTPSIQRNLAITSADLSGKKKGRLGDNSKLSTFRAIQKALDDFHKTSPDDGLGREKLLSVIIEKCDAWLGDKSHQKDKDQQKRDSLTRLKTAAWVERRRVIITKELGIPRLVVEFFQPNEVDQFWNVVMSFTRGDVRGALAQFKTLKPLLGDGANLIESFMKRNQISKIDPALGAMMGGSKFEAKSSADNQAAIELVKAQAQAKLTRFTTLKAEFTRAEADYVAEIAARKQAGQPANPPPALLKAGTPENTEFSKLKLEVPHYEAIISGKAVQDKKGQSGFKDFSEAELYGVMGYTSNLYGAINSPLRSDVGDSTKFTAGHTALAGSITSALHKMKPFKGEVYRHGGDFKGYWAVNKMVGAVVSDMAPLSTATDQKGPANAAEQHEVLEIITSVSGRDVSKMSMFGNKEGEVLFAPGTRFRVVAAFERNGAFWGQAHNENQWRIQNQEDKPGFAKAMAALANDDRKNEFRRVVIKQEVG